MIDSILVAAVAVASVGEGYHWSENVFRCEENVSVVRSYTSGWGDTRSSNKVVIKDTQMIDYLQKAGILDNSSVQKTQKNGYVVYADQDVADHPNDSGIIFAGVSTKQNNARNQKVETSFVIRHLVGDTYQLEAKVNNKLAMWKIHNCSGKKHYRLTRR
jgi:hypothetical protein